MPRTYGVRRQEFNKCHVFLFYSLLMCASTKGKVEKQKNKENSGKIHQRQIQTGLVEVRDGCFKELVGFFDGSSLGASKGSLMGSLMCSAKDSLIGSSMGASKGSSIGSWMDSSMCFWMCSSKIWSTEIWASPFIWQGNFCLQ